MRIKMRKSINLTVDEDLRKLLKRKRINISRYVEKLVYKDLTLSGNHCVFKDVGSNPAGSIPYFLTKDLL